MSSTQTTRRTRTVEEMRAQAEALHASISTQVEQLRDSDQWARFLRFAGSFHQYSLNNVLLILARHPDATAVAGFRAWHDKGRQVRKGEHGIHIFGYSTTTIHSDDRDDEDADGTVRRVPRFPILTVFDINQTDPIDGAEQVTNPTQLLTGTDDHGIVQALREHLTGLGWTLTHERIGGGANGYADGTTRRVVLRTDLYPEQAAKTLLHETAHILLGHTDNPTGYREHRGLMETEAESVAYVVAGLVGFDTSPYSIGYITGWTNGETQLIAATAAHVLAAAHQIISITEPQVAEQS